MLFQKYASRKREFCAYWPKLHTKGKVTTSHFKMLDELFAVMEKTWLF